MVAAWRIAADTPAFVADDLSGAGANHSGGRWNRRGRPCVYAADSIALAFAETLVHLNAGGLPLNRYLVRLDIAEAVWSRRQTLENPRPGWDAIPAAKVSLDAGDDWLESQASAVLVVPSVVVPEECCVLINPLHHDTLAGKIVATKLRKWVYDTRSR